MEILSETEATDISPINLAFVGDAVFALFVKSKLTLTHSYKSGELSRITSR